MSAAALLSRMALIVNGEALQQWSTDPGTFLGFGAIDGSTLTRTVNTVHNASARSIFPLAGKCYFSGVIHTGTAGSSSTSLFGLIDEASSLAYIDKGSTVHGTLNNATNGNSLSVTAGGLVSWNGTGQGTTGVAGNEEFVLFAVDVPTRKVWVKTRYLSSVSGWFGGGDPETGSNPAWTIPGTGNIFAACSINSMANINSSVVIHQNAAETFGTVPTGFTPANWGSL